MYRFHNIEMMVGVTITLLGSKDCIKLSEMISRVEPFCCTDLNIYKSKGVEYTINAHVNCVPGMMQEGGFQKKQCDAAYERASWSHSCLVASCMVDARNQFILE